MLSAVKDGNDQVVVDNFGLRIYKSDLDTLDGNNWLNDKVSTNSAFVHMQVYMYLLITQTGHSLLFQPCGK